MGQRHKNYHLNKTKICSLKGIRLLHIFENDWSEHKIATKSVLANILIHRNEKISARECEVCSVSSRWKDEFLSKNHIKGKDRSSIKLGLIHEKELVAVMTANKSKFSKSDGIEINRFCSKAGYTIVGGMSKLFDTILKSYEPATVVAHCDRRYFSGETYLKLGFHFVDNTRPEYRYVTESYDHLETKNNWRRDVLKKKLKKFQPEKSEWENMKANGFDRIWDCGHSKWVWAKK